MDSAIEDFLQRVRDLAKTRGKQIVLPLAEAQDLSMAIALLMAKSQAPVEKSPEVISVEMDGGKW